MNFYRRFWHSSALSLTVTIESAAYEGNLIFPTNDPKVPVRASKPFHAARHSAPIALRNLRHARDLQLALDPIASQRFDLAMTRGKKEKFLGCSHRQTLRN